MLSAFLFTACGASNEGKKKADSNPLDAFGQQDPNVDVAKANAIEPWAYLKKLFTALPSATTEAEIEALLPWNVEPDDSATRVAKP